MDYLLTRKGRSRLHLNLKVVEFKHLEYLKLLIMRLEVWLFNLPMQPMASRRLLLAILCSLWAFVKQAAGAAPKKVIVVPGRLVNVVI